MTLSLEAFNETLKENKLYRFINEDMENFLLNFVSYYESCKNNLLEQEIDLHITQKKGLEQQLNEANAFIRTLGEDLDRLSKICFYDLGLGVSEALEQYRVWRKENDK